MKKNLLEKKSRTPSSTVETQNNRDPMAFINEIAHDCLEVSRSEGIEVSERRAWESITRRCRAFVAESRKAPSVGDGSGSDTASYSPNPVCCPAHQDLVEALKLAAQQLEDLTPVHLNWHLFTGEIARNLRAVLSKAGEA